MHYHEVPKSEEASTMKVVIADQQSTNSETCSATHSSYMKYTYIYIWNLEWLRKEHAESRLQSNGTLELHVLCRMGEGWQESLESKL